MIKLDFNEFVKSFPEYLRKKNNNEENGENSINSNNLNSLNSNNTIDVNGPNDDNSSNSKKLPNDLSNNLPNNLSNVVVKLPASSFSNVNPDNFYLSPSQLAMTKALDSFLNSNDESVFLLKGYAGTGKTFLLNILYDFLQSHSSSVRCVICAPTGKASLVINKKLGINAATTIHRAIYDTSIIKDKNYITLSKRTGDGSSIDVLLQSTEDEKLKEARIKLTMQYMAQYGSEHADTMVDKFIVPLNYDKPNSENYDLNVYIFDESSMIGNHYSEMDVFRFGSGFLLNDIIEYTGVASAENHTSHKNKIIFCGDPAQLWPVGESCSPALDAEYLRAKYNVNTSEYTLTDILRQQQGSSIMQNSYVLRKAIAEKDFSTLEITKGHDVFELKSNILETQNNFSNQDNNVNQYNQNNQNLDNFENLDNLDSLKHNILPNTNSNVSELPDFIRNSKFFDPKLNDPIIQAYFTISENKMSNKVKILAYDNASVYFLNQKIRSYIWGEYNKPICIGDRIIFMQNSYVGDDLFVYNGEFAQITQILESHEIVQTVRIQEEDIPEAESNPYASFFKAEDNTPMARVTFHVCDVEMCKVGEKGQKLNFQCSILENYLYSPEKDFSHMEKVALQAYRDRMKSYIKKQGINYDEETDDKDVLNYRSLTSAVRIKFGYAITCHKAQGSEWENVFLYCPDIELLGRGENTFHWYYTALTRATKRLFITNSPKMGRFSSVKLMNSNSSNIKGMKRRQTVTNITPKNPESLNSKQSSLNNASPNVVSQIQSIAQHNNVNADVNAVSPEDSFINKIFGNVDSSTDEQVLSHLQSQTQYTDASTFASSSTSISTSTSSAVMNDSRGIAFNELCLRFGIMDPEGLAGWILSKVSAITNKNNLIITEVRSGAFKEQYWVTDAQNSSTLVISIYYKKDNMISKVVSSDVSSDIWKYIGDDLTYLEGTRYQKSREAYNINGEDPRLKRLVDDIIRKYNANGITFSVLERKGFLLKTSFLRVLHDDINNMNFEEILEADIYFNGKFTITNWNITFCDSELLLEDVKRLMTD